MTALTSGAAHVRAAATPPGRLDPGAAVTAAIGALALLVGASVAAGLYVVPVGLLALAIAVAMFVLAERGLTVVVATVPYLGILSLALYPHAYLGLAARDTLLVAPIYLGVAARRLRSAEPLPAGIPLVALLLYGGMVGVQCFNPDGGSLLVRLLGLKTWVFYIPMLVVAYDHCDSLDRIRRLVRLYALVAVPSLLIGVGEAAAIGAGRSDAVFALYGKAANAVSQGNAELLIQGGGTIRRAPSTFTFPAEYYLFIVTVIAAALLWSRLAGSATERRVGLAVAGLATLAALVSGLREAFVGIPLLLGVDFLLRRKSAGGGLLSLTAILGLGAAGVVGLAAVAGSSVGALISHLRDTFTAEYGIVLTSGFRGAARLTQLGLGTGADTESARTAVSNAAAGTPGTLFSAGFESWYVKAWLELGVAGLVIVVALVAAVTLRAARWARAARSAQVNGAAAAATALLAFAVLSSLKSQYLDLEPLAPLFWTFFGVLLRLRDLDAAADPVPAAGASSVGDRDPMTQGTPHRSGFAAPGPRRPDSSSGNTPGTSPTPGRRPAWASAT